MIRSFCLIAQGRVLFIRRSLMIQSQQTLLDWVIATPVGRLVIVAPRATAECAYLIRSLFGDRPCLSLACRVHTATMAQGIQGYKG